MKKIWINVSTISFWTSRPVGIVRVELELTKYFYNLRNSDLDIRYIKYDGIKNKFLEIDRSEIERILLRFEPQEPQFIQGNISSQFIQNNGFKSKIKNCSSRIKVALPSSWSGRYEKLVRILKKGYYHGFLVPKYYLTQYYQKQSAKLAQRFSQPKNDESFPPDFDKNDYFISSGLDWHDLDLKFSILYNLKKQYQLKIILFCYDLIPIKFPHLALVDTANIYSRYFADMAWCADLVLFDSQSAKNDFVSFAQELSLPMPNLGVIRLGDNIISKTRSQEYEDDKLKLILSKPYILFVSTVERRKNHAALYQAYTILVEKYKDELDALPNLIFIGAHGWGVNDLLSDLNLDYRIKNKIFHFTGVSDRDLALAYQNCLFTVFPSLYEGWGLPVAESFSYGKFCLSSNAASLPEVGGEFADYVEPLNIYGWVEKLDYYFRHPSEVEKKEAIVKKNYTPYQWSSFGARVLKDISSNL